MILVTMCSGLAPAVENVAVTCKGFCDEGENVALPDHLTLVGLLMSRVTAR